MTITQVVTPVLANRLSIPCSLSSQIWLPDIKALVAVHMITYNHAPFIAQAIESVLMQETDFRVVLVIGDDCSSDGTRQIVERYAALHPQVIRAVTHDVNIGMHRNSQSIQSVVDTEYVAFLEGDDYWNSLHKLQKQFNFLEDNAECALCCSQFSHVMGRGLSGEFNPSPAQKRIGELKDILRWNYILTCTVMYRREWLPAIPPSLQNLYHGDMGCWVLLAQRGKIGCINEVMSTYRLHDGGVWSGISIEKRIAELLRTINGIHHHLNNQFPRIKRASLCIRYVEFAGQYASRPDHLKAAHWLIKALAKDPITWLGLPESKSLFWNELSFWILLIPHRLKLFVVPKYRKARISFGAFRRRIGLGPR